MLALPVSTVSSAPGVPKGRRSQLIASSVEDVGDVLVLTAEEVEQGRALRSTAKQLTPKSADACSFGRTLHRFSLGRFEELCRKTLSPRQSVLAFVLGGQSPSERSTPEREIPCPSSFLPKAPQANVFGGPSRPFPPLPNFLLTQCRKTQGHGFKKAEALPVPTILITAWSKFVEMATELTIRRYWVSRADFFAGIRGCLCRPPVLLLKIYSVDVDIVQPSLLVLL
jgi:hypothetical protein